MLAKKNRISKKKEVEAVFSRGVSSFDGVLGVKVLPTAHAANRFVVVVSTKVSKRAVTRNALKRRLSELCRMSLPRLKAGSDFFVLALPPAANKSYRELERSLQGNFKRLQVV